MKRDEIMMDQEEMKNERNTATAESEIIRRKTNYEVISRTNEHTHNHIVKHSNKQHIKE